MLVVAGSKGCEPSGPSDSQSFLSEDSPFGPLRSDKQRNHWDIQESLRLGA